MSAILKREVFWLAGFHLLLDWPSGMTRADFEDFAEWLHIIEGKARRAVIEEPVK